MANPPSTQTRKPTALPTNWSSFMPLEDQKREDASFYANLIRRFGASFTVRPGPVAANHGMVNVMVNTFIVMKFTWSFIPGQLYYHPIRCG